jgi:hypothetical protein
LVGIELSPFAVEESESEIEQLPSGSGQRQAAGHI